MSQQPEIFFHVGLGKVASTYLQYDVFPYFEGIRYLQRTQYKSAKRIIGTEDNARYLLSREFDRQLEREVRDFATDFPQTRSILLLRRPDSWIASQYRRFLKNGNPWTFREFFDIEHDRGQWKQRELDFFGKIKTLETIFETPPLVLFYDDLKANPMAFFQRIADYCGAQFDPNKIDLSRRHSSYSPKQLKAMYALSRHLNLRKHQEYRWKALNLGRRLLVNSVRYPTLYAARWLPENTFSDVPLIAETELSRIREAFAENWEQCRQYANTHNPVLEAKTAG